MYLIRASRERPLLNVELSGHVTTDEAARFLTLVAELLKTDRHKGVRCELSGLDYGPDRPASVAAVLAALLPPEVRVAITGPASALRGVGRVVRLAHATANVRTFESAAEADSWLAEVVGVRKSLPTTAQRHAEDLFGAAPGPDPAATPARRTSAA